MDPDEIWAAVNRKEHVSLEYSKQMESLGIDLIITPGGFLPAPDKVSTYLHMYVICYVEFSCKIFEFLKNYQREIL